MYTPEKNKEIVRKLFEEVWNQHRPDRLGEFLLPTVVLTDPLVPLPTKGLDAEIEYMKLWAKTIPDLHFTIEEQIAEDDRVVTRLLAEGTHEGVLLGVPPTHQKAKVPCVVFHRFKGEKIAEAVVMWDAYAFLRATGALEAVKPALATA
ncbi:MAG TPA: ester cyclase [Longimicrobiales bacterium]|nr:ester cyclase [Longimicrobiales bacterium]